MNVLHQHSFRERDTFMQQKKDFHFPFCFLAKIVTFSAVNYTYAIQESILSFTLDGIPYAEVMFFYALRKKTLHHLFISKNTCHSYYRPFQAEDIQKCLEKTSIGKENRKKNFPREGKWENNFPREGKWIFLFREVFFR